MWKIGSFVDKWIFKKGIRLIKVIGCGKEVVILGDFLSEYYSEKMRPFARLFAWIALVKLVFNFAFFLSHQLRLVLNIYEGVLVVLHGEAESNWPEWWATAVWLSHCPLFSWILGRRFEINWAFFKYLLASIKTRAPIFWWALTFYFKAINQFSISIFFSNGPSYFSF